MNQSHKISRLSSDFSIERILAEDSETKSRESSHQHVLSTREDKKYCTNDSTTTEYSVPRFNANSRLEFSHQVPSGIHTSSPHISSATNANLLEIFPPTHTTENLKLERNELAWLHCTRYRPPKLPRKSSSGKTGKRRPGAHPRIPFTGLQIQILEDKYRSTAYLSRRDVVHLSTTLRLPQSRVKIWFQNRRARDRRESGIVGSNITITSGNGSMGHKSSDSPTEKSPSTNPP